MSPRVTPAVEGLFATRNYMVQGALLMVAQHASGRPDVPPEFEHVGGLDPFHSRVEEELDQEGSRSVDQVVPGQV